MHMYMKFDPEIPLSIHIFLHWKIYGGIHNKVIQFSSICKCCFKNKKEKRNPKVAGNINYGKFTLQSLLSYKQ